MNYICKVNGSVNSEQCATCFKKDTHGHLSRPLCVDDNAVKIENVSDLHRVV